MELAVRSKTEVRALTLDWFETEQKCSPSTVIGPEQNKNIALNGSLRTKLNICTNSSPQFISKYVEAMEQSGQTENPIFGNFRNRKNHRLVYS